MLHIFGQLGEFLELVFLALAQNHLEVAVDGFFLEEDAFDKVLVKNLFVFPLNLDFVHINQSAAFFKSGRKN